MRAAGNWTLEKITDVTTATGEWSGRTRFDPFIAGSGPASIRVDGVFPPQCSGGWQAGDIAVNCVHATARKDGQIIDFMDIWESHISIDLSPGNPGEGWNYGPDNPAGNEYDLRGVITHELGHAVLLIDLWPCAAGDAVETMCGGAAPGLFTVNLRTLTTDDINGANLVYPV